MKKIITSMLLIAVIVSTSSCATILGGRIDRCQTHKRDFVKETGLPHRHIRWVAFAFDIIMPPMILNLGIDFLTGAIYKPCEYYPTKTETK